MTKYLDIYSDLIKLAAQMAKGEGVPDWSERVFSTGTPSYERRDMLSALRLADEAGITHALQLRAIADRLSAEMRSSNEPEACGINESLDRAAEAIRQGRMKIDAALSPGASRDADHCDYPDCEQHWTHVVAQARAILEPLADCDPAIRQWLKTPDLPKLQGASPDASPGPNAWADAKGGLPDNKL